MKLKTGLVSFHNTSAPILKFKSVVFNQPLFSIYAALRRKSEDWLARNQNNVSLFSIYATLRRKSEDWLARNQNNVSDWSDMSTRKLLFQ